MESPTALETTSIGAPSVTSGSSLIPHPLGYDIKVCEKCNYIGYGRLMGDDDDLNEGPYGNEDD